MDNSTLEVMATAIMTALKGYGTWQLSCKDYWKPPKDPIRGLTVGQNVYSFNEDDDAIQEETIVAVHEDIGYVFWFSKLMGPSLVAVAYDIYETTLKDAIRSNKLTIQANLEYHQERAEIIDRLKEMIDKVAT